VCLDFVVFTRKKFKPTVRVSEILPRDSIVVKTTLRVLPTAAESAGTVEVRRPDSGHGSGFHLLSYLYVKVRLSNKSTLAIIFHSYLCLVCA
jgi:hypothetical protein